MPTAEDFYGVDPTLMHGVESYPSDEAIEKANRYLLDQAQLGVAEGLTWPMMLADIPHMVSEQTLEMPLFEKASRGVAEKIGYEDFEPPGGMAGETVKPFANIARLGTSIPGPVTQFKAAKSGIGALTKGIQDTTYGNLPVESRRAFLKGMGYTSAAAATGIAGLKVAKHISDLPSVKAVPKMSLSKARQAWWNQNPERSKFISSKMQDYLQDIAEQDLSKFGPKVEKLFEQSDAAHDLGNDLYMQVNKSAADLKTLGKSVGHNAPEYLQAKAKHDRLWKQYQDNGNLINEIDGAILRDMPEDVFAKQHAQHQKAAAKAEQDYEWHVARKAEQDSLDYFGPNRIFGEDVQSARRYADDAKDEAYKFEQNMVKGFGKDRDDYARALQDKTGAIH